MIEGIFSNNIYAASKRLLDVTQLRHQALASNIANLETPGYKRVDLPKDFSKEFAAKLHSGAAQKMAMPSIIQDQNATSQRLDGNNVDMDKELIELSSNTMQYDTLSEFVSNSLKQLKVAITGHNS